MALPVDFEGRNLIYTHPDCYDLPVHVQQTVLDSKPVMEVVSAWQLSPDELRRVIESGGIVFLRVIGGQPPVEVTGINPIKA